VNERRRWLLTALFILWIFFVLSSFFAVQKPFSVDNALAALRTVLDLAAAGWMVLLALAMGTRLLRLLLREDPSPLESLVLGTALGLGALGLLSLALGLAGLFHPAVALGVTVVLSVVFAPQMVHLCRRWRDYRLDNRPGWPIALYLSLLTLLTLAVALLPATDMDGLFYHLTAPKLYLQQGGIRSGIDIPHLSFPSLMEMLYAWAMLLRGDVAAKLLHALFGWLLAGLVYLTTRRSLAPKAAWRAVAVLASMPMVSTLAGWAYNDLALAFFQLASLYAFLKSANRPIGDQPIGKTRWLALSGIFAGLALGLKYTGFITPLVIASLILWRTYHVSRSTEHGARSTLSSLAAFALPALLVALPWYVKNWAFTGNPVYPFLSNLFDSLHWDAFRNDWYSASGTGIGLRPTTLLALPWLITLGVRDVNYWDGRTGPLFLIFLPFILLYGLFRYRRRAPDRPPALDALLAFALAQFIFWTAGVIWSRLLWQSRLLLPCLAALSPVVGWLWTDLPRFDPPRFSMSGVVRLAIGLTLVLTLADLCLLTLKIDPFPYLIGTETRDEYLTRRLGTYYATMQQINEDLPASARIVFLWEPRSYYCRRDCRPDSILDAFPHLVYQHGSAEAIARVWHKEGITHVLIHRSGLNFLLDHGSTKVDTALLAQLEVHFLSQVFDVQGAYQVYALVPDQQASP
jgi:4-amino-4-deoxy-L-arabinose transferase-like glycosyltransferase